MAFEEVSRGFLQEFLSQENWEILGRKKKCYWDKKQTWTSRSVKFHVKCCKLSIQPISDYFAEFQRTGKVVSIFFFISGYV